jgi:hypothetical protein
MKSFVHNDFHLFLFFLHLIHISRAIAKSCTADEIRFGKWIPNASNCGLLNKYLHPLTAYQETPANEDMMKVLGWPVNGPWPFSDWCWVPTGCEYTRFSREKFCKKLNGKDILFVGDSLQHQFFEALYMQLNLPGSPQHQWYTLPLLNERKGGEICEDLGGGRFAFLRNDQVAVEGNVNWNESGQPHNRDWTQVLQHYDYVVLNKGAHYIASEPEFIDTTNKTAYLLRDQFILGHTSYRNATEIGRRHVFYRTAAPGHWFAHANSSADQSTLTEKPIFQCPPDNRSAEYHHFCNEFHWDKYYERNDLAVDIFRRALGNKLTGQNTFLLFV